MGVRDIGGRGCIIADEMGLGKTLQSLTVLYIIPTFLSTSGERMVKRTIVVCPCSLINNWNQEFQRWINFRVNDETKQMKILPLSVTDKKSVESGISRFLHPSCPYDVLIISYDTVSSLYVLSKIIRPSPT